jgi:tol-pal system protein YbgF
MNYKTLLLALIVVMFGCALNQDVVTLDDNMSVLEARLARIEKSQKELEFSLGRVTKSGATKEQDFRNKTAAMRVNFSSITEEIQAIRGKLEETEFLLKEQIKPFEKSEQEREAKILRLEKKIRAQTNRIERLEDYLNLEAASSKSKNTGSRTGGGSTGPLTDHEAYAQAKKAFDRGEYETARSAFFALIKKFPKSTHADNAQFWVGETYYREKWYEKAILEYQQVIEKFPRGNKVPSALLKQGFAFYNLGDKANARLILKELIKKYPKSSETKIARKKLREYQ